MQRVTLAVILGLPVAIGVSFWLGGRLGAGVLAGFTMGAFIGGVGVAYQQHVLRTRPQAALATVVVGLGAKLVAVLIGGLAFRYIEPAAARVDYRSFLVAFAATAVLLLFVSLPDVARVLKAAHVQGAKAQGAKAL